MTKQNAKRQRGYMITPIILIVMFIVLSMFLFYSSELDLMKTKALNNEMSFKKLLIDSEKTETKIDLISLETLYKNNDISNKTVLENLINQKISANLNIIASIIIENSSMQNKSSALNISMNLTDSNGNNSIKAVNFNYSTEIAYPSFDINYFYETFDPNQICDYKIDYCKINETDFELNKTIDTGYVWNYTELDCDSNVFNFTITIYDEDNFLSKRYPNKLQDKTDNDNIFTATC